MTYDHNRHHRRSIRLRGYDYTQSGAYFITICSRDRASIFADIVNGVVRLTPVGEVVAICWEAIPGHFPSAELDAFVVMPNHLHGIVVLGDADIANSDTACRVPTDGPASERFGAPVAGSIPTIVRSFKGAVTKAINDDLSRGTACRNLLTDRLGPLPRGRIPSPWQANYHEHIIRNDRALTHLRDYIATNPARWLDDSLHPNNAQAPPIFRSRPRQS
jgi:REP element-mobilizing transposase RayT